jgi:hypothetical protein
MIVDPDRVIRAVRFPVLDPAASVEESLAQLSRLRAADSAGGRGHR